MTTYDDATIWQVAEALYNYSYSSEFGQLDSSEKAEYYGMAEAALDAIPQDDKQPDADLVRWNPDSGSLWSALKEVPGDHMVMVTITADEVRELHSKVMSAEWRPPLPSWAAPNLPLVTSVAGKLWVLFGDRLYRQALDPVTPTRTAYQLEDAAAYIGVPVCVVIDANGLHVKDTL